MNKLKLADTLIVIVIVLLICTGWVAAQSDSLAFNSGFVAGSGQPTVVTGDIAELGSISGRVLAEAELNANNPRGIGGVRIIIRSAESGLGAVVRDRISDAAGTFDFPDLRPGQYIVEIDPASIPAKFRLPDNAVSTVSVKPSTRSKVNVPIAARRSITGILFIDKDGDGQFNVEKDEPVAGAYVTVNGKFAVSDADGRYVLRELPPGRIGLLVSWPNGAENTHVVLDLGDGPVTNRVVNVPLIR